MLIPTASPAPIAGRAHCGPYHILAWWPLGGLGPSIPLLRSGRLCGQTPGHWVLSTLQHSMVGSGKPSEQVSKFS